eukprot:223712-Pyramimonas_sp.AAC.1
MGAKIARQKHHQARLRAEGAVADVRIKPRGWHGHMSMRAAALTCTAPSCSASGSSTNNKPESTRAYSSVWGNNRVGT